VLDLGRTLLFYGGVVVVVGLGVSMLAAIAPGWNFDLGRAVIKVLTKKQVSRIGISVLGVVIGIAFLLHFAPLLQITPEQAAPGAVLGMGLVLGGISWLTQGGRSQVRRMALSVTAVVLLVVIAFSAIGAAVS
jgi:hypothetical protein